MKKQASRMPPPGRYAGSKGEHSRRPPGAAGGSSWRYKGMHIKSPGQGMKRAGEQFPGLIELICLILWASSAFFVWFDPYGPAVLVMPIMPADRKHPGRAAMMPARMDPRAAVAML